MPQTQADLVRQMLKSLLEKQPSLARTVEGRSELAIVVAHVLKQTCQVQHWFGPQHAGVEQDLLVALNSAQPEDTLPSPLQVDNLHMLAKMDLAAAIMPALTPISLLFKVLDSCTFTLELKPQDHLPAFKYCPSFISVPAPELKPDHKMVLLRSAVLATKLLSLISNHTSTDAVVEDLACSCVTMVCRLVFSHIQELADNPTEGSQAYLSGQQEQQMCLVLVRMLVPFLQQGIKAACISCSRCQSKANTAADMLCPWMLPNQGGIVADLADNLLVSGCGVVLMSCLQQKLSWAPNAVMLLSAICSQAKTQKAVATALLNKVQALLWVAPMLHPLPELANAKGIFDADIAWDPMIQAATIRATATMLFDMVQLHSQPTDLSYQSAAAVGPPKIAACVSIPVRTALTVGCEAWAALEWSMQHVAGKICITDILDLLLAVASPLLDLSTDVNQMLCVGLPALLRCVASPSTGSTVAQELLGLMLDRLATDPSLDLLSAAVKIEGALQTLVKAVCTQQHDQELGHLQKEAIYAILCVPCTRACIGITASQEIFVALSDVVLSAAVTCPPTSTLQHCAACMCLIAGWRNFAKRQDRGQAHPSWVLLTRMVALLEDHQDQTRCLVAAIRCLNVIMLAEQHFLCGQDVPLGIKAGFSLLKAADRTACDPLLEVSIMTAATHFLSDCVCEYDTKKSLQANFANQCGTQVLVDNLVKTSSACIDAPTESSQASSKLRPHHKIGLAKTTQLGFQIALVDCIMKTVLSSASPKEDVLYFVHHGLMPMFGSFSTALVKAITHSAASPNDVLEQAKRDLSEVKKLWSGFVQVLVACHSHGWPDAKQPRQLMENHLVISLLEHTRTIILRVVHTHKQSREEQHSRVSGPQQVAKGKSRAQRDASDLLPESLKQLYNSKMQMLTELLVCMSEGVCLIQSQSLWQPHFEEEQQRFFASSHMPAFTQAMQACDESHLLPPLTLNRLSSLFALQTDEAHPSPVAKSGRKVVSVSAEYIAGDTAIEQLLAEEESARAKTASKKAKRQRQQQKKRNQSSLSEAGLVDPPVQPESQDHYSITETLPSSVTDAGPLQADSETSQSSSPSQPGSMQTDSSTDDSPPKPVHMTVPSDAVQCSDHCADTKLRVSASACIPSMSEASQDQLAPEVLDATAPQGCSEPSPPDSQKRPSQPQQYTACLQSLAQTDLHLYDGVGIPQPHAINSLWRPTGLQEALASHHDESLGKQVPADTQAIETAYQAAGFPDITPKRAKHYLGSLFCCPLTKVMMQDPVIAADGHTYERDAMATWLQHHDTSPVTGQLLKHTRRISNLAIKCMIGA